MTSHAQPRSRRHLSRGVFDRASTVALLASAASLALNPVPLAAKDKAKQESGQLKITLSPKFQPVYIDFAKKLDADKARPDVAAAEQKATAAADQASQKAAQAELAALLSADKAQLPTVVAAAVTADDRYTAAQLEYQLGNLALDPVIERQGVEGMLASGKADPVMTGKLQAAVGDFAYQADDFPAAITAYQTAIAGGYQADEIEVKLADSYLRNKQIDKGLPALQHAIDVRKAAGQPVPIAWYRSGVVAAYNAKQVEPTLSFGTGLIQQEPTKENWALLIEVVQRVAGYPAQDELDLMRLMGRTHSYAQKADYLEYIQSADPRRLPGEVLDVIAAGEASGMLSASEPSVAEARSVAAGRVTADRASLPSLERDARAGGASAAIASAAGDAALSYGQAGDALAMYQIALAKPGVDAPRVLTRMGIAQIDTGDFAGAQASFAKVTGPRQPLAHLWSIYAAQKAAGK